MGLCRVGPCFLEKEPKSARKVTKVPKKWQTSALKCRKVSKLRDFIALVVLSTHTHRVGVSRMQDFLLIDLV